MKTLKEMLEERARLWEQMKALNEKARGEKRELTAEESAQWDAMDKDLTELTTGIAREKRAAELERLMSEPARPGFTGHRTPTPDAAQAEQRCAYKEAFNALIRSTEPGMSGLTPEQRQALLTGAVQLTPEMRAQSVGTTTAGGFLVAQDFSDQLERALKFYSSMIGVSDTSLRTATGADLPWPTVNDTTVVGAILAENASIGSAVDVTFGSLTFKAYMYTSNPVLVSYQLMQDSTFDMDALLADLLAERIGRILNTHFTTGTGTAQPRGVVTGATLGKTGLTGQTVSVIYDDLVDLVYSVDRAYRPQGQFMMNDLSIAVVRKLKDSQNRPIWEPSTQAGEPDRLMGYRVVPNNDVAVMAANAKSILFGDFSKYKVRTVREMSLLRLVERYADFLQVGFIMFGRWDGNLVNAGTNPVKYYANSAT